MTYDTDRHVSPGGGAAVVHGDVHRRAGLCAAARATSRASRRPRALPLEHDPDSDEKTAAHEPREARDRRGNRRRDHRPRMGRHQGAEQAAAAVVALDVLCHHRLGLRLLDRLSGLADADGYTKGMLGYSQRAAVAAELAAAAGRARRPSRPARRDAARRDRARSRPAALRHGRRRRRVSATIARPATAAVRKASMAIPTSTTTIGCGAARSRTSSKTITLRRPLATSTRRAPAQMPRFGLDQLLDDQADRRRRRLRAVACRAKSSDAGTP